MEIAEYRKMDAIESNHWWFVAKRAFLDIVLKKRTASISGLRVLDIGCGTGAIMDFFSKQGAIVEGIDMSNEALRFCRDKGLNVQLGTAEKPGYADDTFDIIIASDVLEHIQDDKIAVEHIYRILKPGGLFIATVPAHQFLFSYHDEALHHMRRYSKTQFSSLLNSIFSQVSISWAHAGILLPAIVLRFFTMPGRSKRATGSDVQTSSKLINSVMGGWYFFELGFFKLFGKLPWGLSLIAVCRK